MNKVYIFGAHSRAKTLGIYLRKLEPDICIIAYLVDNDEINELSIQGSPVQYITEGMQYELDAPIYLGIKGIYHCKIIEKLANIGFKNVIPVTPELDCKLRNDFLKLYYKENNCNFDKLDNYKKRSVGSTEDVSASLYVAKTIFDKTLLQSYNYMKDEKDIQVGAALAGGKISSVVDNVGDNISARNQQFCELTGMYWLWKNASEDIIGLEHYRRHFILEDSWKDVMIQNKIDVILPTPLYVYPSVAQNYRERHVATIWEYMLERIKAKYPDSYEIAYEYFEKSGIYSPCNMFIMKRHILDELCSWLFPIIFDCADYFGVLEDSYQNRYPGFLAERLVTLFFEMNKDNYNIVYADKDFRQ